jgi:hypothetical protein
MIQENRRIKQTDIAVKLGISPGKLLLKNFLTDIVLKGMISSRILPLETNTGFIITTQKTKDNPWTIVIEVL